VSALLLTSLAHEPLQPNGHFVVTTAGVQGQQVKLADYAHSHSDLPFTAEPEEYNPETFALANEVFFHYDTNHDGYLSAAELGDVMAGLGEQVTDDQLAASIRDMDTDNNGKIDVSEYLALVTASNDSHGDLENAFAMCDTDHNGVVSPQEFQKFMNSMGNYTEASIRKLTAKADLDGNGEIDHNEFMASMGLASHSHDDHHLQQHSHSDFDQPVHVHAPIDRSR